MGLIVPRNRLIFPGGRPEVNRNHPAATQHLRYAGVSFGKTFLNLVTGKGATISAGSPVAMPSVAGPGTSFITSGSALSSPDGVGELPITGVTMAAIITPSSTGVGFGGVFATGPIGGADYGIILQGGFFTTLSNNSTGRVAAIPVYAANRPYFYGCCFYPSSNSGFVALATALTDLTTGQVWFGTANGTKTMTTVTSTTYVIGGNGASNSSLAVISALMHAADGIPTHQLFAWAHDPWSFWYPQSAQKLIGNMALSAPSASIANHIVSVSSGAVVRASYF